jgi:hypothetical protein
MIRINIIMFRIFIIMKKFGLDHVRVSLITTHCIHTPCFNNQIRRRNLWYKKRMFIIHLSKQVKFHLIIF